MRILHTSDWHLGKLLYGKKDRIAEHLAFFEWLLKIIENQKIDLLIVAGDIFDTATPSWTAQKMYYGFLIQVIKTCCKKVIIVGGNHDSPSFLNAPKEILASLDVYVIGHATESIEDEVIIINNEYGEPELIVCAVPFLRTKDLIKFIEGENYSDQSKRINEGIKKHYEKIAEIAENKLKEIGKKIPVIATGHLSVSGGLKTEDDGERGTYIGNIEAINSNIFPQIFDYIALGHYHVPSVIQHHIRYCGSPIPLGFGELGHDKMIFVLEFKNELVIDSIKIPVFQEFHTIIGDKNEISNKIFELKSKNTTVCVEVNYTGNELISDLSQWLMEETANSNIEVLKSKTTNKIENPVIKTEKVDLTELTVMDVFENLLIQQQVNEEQKEKMIQLYQEILESIQTND